MTKKRESRMWERLRPHLAGLDAVRVEAPESQGVPDVNYVHGWVELKRIAAWPRRHYSIVRIPSLTAEQRAWANRRVRSGGQSWLLLHVEEEDDWLLFFMGRLDRLIGACQRVQLEATAYWSARTPEEPQWEALRSCLGYVIPSAPGVWLDRPGNAGAHAG